MKTETIILGVTSLTSIVMISILTYQYFNHRRRYLSLVKRTIYFALYEVLLHANQQHQLTDPLSKTELFEKLALKECHNINLSTKQRFNFIIKQGFDNTIRINLENQVQSLSYLLAYYRFNNLEQLYKLSLEKSEDILANYFYELDFINAHKQLEQESQKQLELCCLTN